MDPVIPYIQTETLTIPISSIPVPPISTNSAQNELPSVIPISFCNQDVDKPESFQPFVMHVMLSEDTHFVSFLLDPGAKCSILNEAFVMERQWPITISDTSFLFLDERAPLIKSIGRVSSLIRFQGYSSFHVFEIARLSSSPSDPSYMGIIGRDLACQWGMTISFPFHSDAGLDKLQDVEREQHLILQDDDLLPAVLPHIQDLISHNKKLHGFCNHERAIINLPFRSDVTPTKPIYVKQYRIAKKLVPIVTAQVDSWLKDGVTVYCLPDTQYNNPLLCSVNKSDSGAILSSRVCLVPHAINENLITDRYPLPDVQGILDKLSSASYFAELDLKRAFNQFMLNPTDRPKTAFTWLGKRYMFVGLPFGVANGSSCFQATMDLMLGDIPNLHIFVDNLIIGSPTIDAHIATLKQVLNRLNQFNLRLNPDKCCFVSSSCRILGYLVSRKGISIDPSKLEMVKDWSVPTNKKEVQSFLGFLNYSRKHIPNYAEHTQALQDSITNPTFQFNDACISAFHALKNMVANLGVLNHILPNKKLHLSTDASSRAISAVLFQPRADELRPTPGNIIAFYSKSLSSSQVKYDIFRKELLAVVSGLRHFHDLLFACPFVLWTDNMALTWIKSSNNRTVTGWAMTLMEYNFHIMYLSSRENSAADFLSRVPSASASLATVEYPSPKAGNHPPSPVGDNRIVPTISWCGVNTRASTKQITKASHALKAQDLVSPTVPSSLTSSPSPPDSFSPSISPSSSSLDFPLWNDMSPQSKIKDPIRTSDSPLVRTSPPRHVVVPLDPTSTDPHSLHEPISTLSDPPWGLPSDSPCATDEVSLSSQLQPLIPKGSVLNTPDNSQIPDVGLPPVSKDDILPPVLPPVPLLSTQDRLNLIKLEHEQGHFSCKYIEASLVKKGHHWPHMRTEIEDYTRSCLTCMRHNTSKQGFNPLFSPTSTQPMGLVQVDLYCALPRSDKGNRYVLVAIDLFTGYTFLYPIQSKEALEIASTLLFIFCQFGFPSTLSSDQGSEFCNSIIAELTDHVKTFFRLSTPYSPRGKGRVENRMKLINVVLRKFLDGDYSTWDVYLPQVMYFINNKVDLVTRSRPFDLMFGRPNPLATSLSPAPLDDPETSKEWTQHLSTLKSIIYPLIAAETRSVRKKQSEYYSKHHNIVPSSKFVVGSLVMLKNTSRSSKLEPLFEGPYRITSINPNKTFQLEDGNAPLTRPVPVNHLKLISDPVSSMDQSVPLQTLPDDVYAIDKILGHRGKGSRRQYLVKWKGEDDLDWVPVQNFLDTQCITDYLRSPEAKLIN